MEWRKAGWSGAGRGKERQIRGTVGCLHMPCTYPYPPPYYKAEQGYCREKQGKFGKGWGRKRQMQKQAGVLKTDVGKGREARAEAGGY